jgi:hypothetical protein
VRSSIESCRAAADALLAECPGIGTDADTVTTVLYLYRLEWLCRFRHLYDADDACLASAPAVEEQNYDCAWSIAEFLGGEVDPLMVYDVIDRAMRSEVAAGVKPFKFVRTHSREIVEYGEVSCGSTTAYEHCS